MKRERVEKSPIRTMFWKDEILQLLYWMNGEGMGAKVDVPQILPFLNTNPKNLEYHLHKLTQEGYLDLEERSKKSYFQLSETGKKEGARHFAEAFQGMQKAGHGECGPDCEFCYGEDGEKLDNCVHNCASQN